MKVSEDEIVKTMCDEKARMYLRACIVARRNGSLSNTLLGLVEGSDLALMHIDNPASLSRILGKNLFCVVVSQRAAKNCELTKAILRRIMSRFLGVGLPKDGPRPCMILVED